jgi:hypothetical protein
MRIQRQLWVTALLAATGMTIMACGSDDGGDDTGSSNAAVSACRTLCDKQEAGGCTFFESAADCKAFCGGIASTSADCQSKSQASSDCQNAQPDACDDAAVQTACGAQIDAEFDCE